MNRNVNMKLTPKIIVLLFCLSLSLAASEESYKDLNSIKTSLIASELDSYTDMNNFLVEHNSKFAALVVIHLQVKLISLTRLWLSIEDTGIRGDASKLFYEYNDELTALIIDKSDFFPKDNILLTLLISLTELPIREKNLSEINRVMLRYYTKQNIEHIEKTTHISKSKFSPLPSHAATVLMLNSFLMEYRDLICIMRLVTEGKESTIKAFLHQKIMYYELLMRIQRK